MKAGTLSTLRRLVLLGLGGVVAAQSGCAENDVSFFIYQVQSPTTSCGYDNNPTGSALREGTWDLALSDGYNFAPLLASQIGSRADPMFGRADAQYVQVEGFEVEVHDGSPDGVILERPYTIYQTTLLRPPSLGGTAYNFAVFQAIPPVIARRLRGEVCANAPADGSLTEPSCVVRNGRSKRLIIHLRGFGHTIGGYNVETPAFDFPVNVCCGCLPQFSAEADGPEPTTASASTLTAGPDCLGAGNATGLGICTPGQDFPLDCRACVHRAAVCTPLMARQLPFTCPSI